MPRSSWQASLADPPVPETDLRARYRDASRRRRVVVGSLVVVLGVAAVLGGLALLSRWRYGTWPFARYPSALHYCGRTYDRIDDERVPRSYDRVKNEDVPEPIYAAFTYDAPLVSSHQVFADVERGGHVGDSTACAGELFIRQGAHRVVAYRLVGDA